MSIVGKTIAKVEAQLDTFNPDLSDSFLLTFTDGSNALFVSYNDNCDAPHVELEENWIPEPERRMGAWTPVGEVHVKKE